MAPQPYGIIITFSLCYFYKSLVIRPSSLQESVSWLAPWQGPQLHLQQFSLKFNKIKPPGLCPLCLCPVLCLRVYKVITSSIQNLSFIYFLHLSCIRPNFELNVDKFHSPAMEEQVPSLVGHCYEDTAKWIENFLLVIINFSLNLQTLYSAFNKNYMGKSL